MKRTTALLTVLWTGLALSVPARAAFTPQATAVPGSAPQGINYQGRLEDNNSPVTGTKSMVFRVYDAASGGNLLWTNPAQTVNVTLGLFNVPVPVPISALVGGGARYLEVQIDGTLMAPRELLNSVPYALIAKSVEGTIDVSTAGLSIFANASATQPSIFVSSLTGNVGVGTTNPGQRLTIGDGTQTPLFAHVNSLNSSIFIGESGSTRFGYAPGAAGLVLQANNIPLAIGTFGATDFTLGSDNTANMTIRSGGNVGIGTTNPAAKLQVVGGDVLIGNPPLHDLTANEDLLVKGNVVIDGTFIGHTTSGSSVTFTSSGEFIVGTSTFVVTSGKVGIGTTSPATTLSVAGNMYATGGLGVGIVNATVGSAIIQATGGSAASSLQLNQTSGLNWNIQAGPSGLFSLNDVSNTKTPIEITSGGGGGNIRLGKNSDYNVGIATATPAGLLHVGAGATPGLLVNASGNVGIGTTNPQNLLHVANAGVNRIRVEGGAAFNKGIEFFDGSTEGVYIQRESQNKLAFYVGDGVTRDMTILDTGNVGIGATSPASKLHVSGGDIQVGDVTASTLTASGALTLANRTSSPAAAKGRIFFDANGDGALRISLDGLSYVPISTGTSGSANDASKVLKAGDTMTGTLNMNTATAFNTTNQPGLTIATHVFVSAGNVGIGTVNPAQRLSVVGTSSMTASAAASQALIVQGASGQTANLQEWQSNAGSVLSRINSSGQFVGDGSQLTGVVATDVGSPVTMNIVNAKTTTTNGGITVATNVFISAGNVGIGTTSPQQPLHILGANRKVLRLDTGGGLAQTFVEFINNTKTWQIGNHDGFGNYTDWGVRNMTDGISVLNITAAGSVGIGTAGPTATLHVSSAATSATTPILIVSSGTAAGQELLYVRKDGNVGIGTTSPNQAGYGTARVLSIRGPNGRGILELINPAGGTTDTLGIVSFMGTGAELAELRGVADGATDKGVISFHTRDGAPAPPERMRITSTGNVGIGTTSPNLGVRTRALTFSAGTSGDVRGDIEIQGNRATLPGDVGYFGFFNGANAVAEVAGFATTAISGGLGFNYVNSVGAGTRGMTLDNAGNVGIGTTSPGSTLHVSGNYIQIPTTTALPPSADCDVGAEMGRMIVVYDQAATQHLAICSKTSAGPIQWQYK